MPRPFAPAMLLGALAVATASAAGTSSCPISTAVASQASTSAERAEIRIADGSAADLDGAVDGACEATLRLCLGETGRCTAEPVETLRLRGGAARSLRDALDALPGTSASGGLVRFDDEAAMTDACVASPVRVRRRHPARVRLTAKRAAGGRARTRVRVACVGADAADLACDAAGEACPPPPDGGKHPAAGSLPTHPRVYLGEDDVTRIRALVADGAEPWATALDEAIGRAQHALAVTPQSVTDGGQDAGSHDYRSDPPYTNTDGIPDPAVDRADYEAAVAVSGAVRDLGIAYAFTGESRYAEKARQLVDAWALDPATAMTPRFTNGQSHIELGITMPALFYGADLIWNDPGWTTEQHAGFEAWVRAFLASARTWSAEQNFENWRHVFLATAAAFVDDVPSMRYAFQRFRAVIDDQMSARGEMVRELERTRSLFYSTYALNAMLQTAEVARLHGVDLYDYTTSSGKGLELALDFHAPYVVAPDTWPHPQITDYAGENAAMYELAWAHWRKPDYRRAIETWGRPMIEERVMGSVTLTHGRPLGR